MRRDFKFENSRCFFCQIVLPINTTDDRVKLSSVQKRRTTQTSRGEARDPKHANHEGPNPARPTRRGESRAPPLAFVNHRRVLRSGIWLSRFLLWSSSAETARKTTRPSSSSSSACGRIPRLLLVSQSSSEQFKSTSS
jgi:hypothetical protein